MIYRMSRIICDKDGGVNMTDKEIAQYLQRARNMASAAIGCISPDNSYMFAKDAIRKIHRIINSIHWED